MNIDNVIAEIEALATTGGKILLPNPYEPELNADLFTEKGFGIQVGSAAGTDQFTYKQPFHATLRVLGLVFTSKIIGNPQTEAVIKTAEQSIRQQAFDLYKEIYNNITIAKFVTSLSFSSDELTFFGGENGYENVAFTLNVNFLIRDKISDQ